MRVAAREVRESGCSHATEGAGETAAAGDPCMYL
jgi:hypothetical protein